MKNLLFLSIVVSFMVFSCTEDRLDNIIDNNPPDPIDTTDLDPVVERGYLFINEFAARGSEQVNEFGTTEDWLEIYNPSSSEVLLKSGEWFVSDDGDTDYEKYELPEVSIPANGFLLIWCDGLDTVATQIHTNFNLSGSGEHISLYHIPSSGGGIVVDDYSYGDQSSGSSEGRYPDGGEAWTVFSIPTPGASNN